ADPLQLSPTTAIVVSTYDRTFNVGEEVELICTTDTQYEPTFSWKLDNGQDHKVENQTVTFTFIEYVTVTCIVSNTYGIATGELSITQLDITCKSVDVTVPVPIIGFKTDTTLLECTYITTGGNPLVYWYKGSSTATGTLVIQSVGGVIYPEPGFTRHDIQDQASLVITNTMLSDAGMYWCKVIAFPDGSDEDSVTLTGEVATEPSQPSITFIDGSIISNASSKITMQCTSSGNPTPIYNNSELTINPSDRDDNGRTFTCQAVNFKGSNTEDKTLTIRYKPYFVNVSKNQRSYASKGSVAELRCEIESNPLSSIIWYGPNNQPINIDSRISIKTVSRGTLYESILTIQNTMLSDYGSYSCFAENDIGNTTFIVTFNDKSVPDAPKSIVPITRFYDSLVVTIIPGYDGGDADTTYFIQYRTRRNATFNELNADNSETTNITIEILELDPSIPYECRAYAVNAIGIGPYSNSIMIRTLDEPIVELDHDTTILSWTRHENETYTCVKIETRHVDVTWDVIVKCIDRNILEYKVNDTNREYRITYCTADGFCESREFSALTRTSYRLLEKA
ncbi:neural cell adhesion molecule 2-like, partial [Saccoglossus kowalevskii]